MRLGHICIWAISIFLSECRKLFCFLVKPMLLIHALQLVVFLDYFSMTDISNKIVGQARTCSGIVGARFFRNSLAILLILTSTGCARVNSVCQSGWLGRNFGLLPLLLETFVVATILALVISTAFYLLFLRPKLRKWNLSSSLVAPKPVASYLFPIALILLLLVFGGVFVGADCSDTQKSVHVIGAILGLTTGFFIGFGICRNIVTKPFRKIESTRD